MILLSLNSEAMQMTPKAVKETVLASVPTAKHITEAVETYAAQNGISVPTLWRYLREGLPERAPKLMARQLLRDAQNQGVEV